VNLRTGYKVVDLDAIRHTLPTDIRGHVERGYQPWNATTAANIQKLGAATSSAGFDFSAHIDEVQDQPNDDCVGEAIASERVIDNAIAGIPIARPSAFFPWTLARLLGSPGKPLVDEGCDMRLACAILAKHGYVPKSDWDSTPDNVLTVPPADLLAASEGAVSPSFYMINDADKTADGILEAGARGLCTKFAMVVTDAYANIGTGVYGEEAVDDSKIIGGHAQLVIGFNTVLDAFLVLNSWSKDFGNGGLAWIARRYMAQVAYGRLICDSIPRKL
jgi:hypothetical protein